MNLIPEKRMDKNGRLVTRRVRASAPAPADRKLPAPNVSQIDAKYHPLTTKAQLAFFELMKSTIDYFPASSRYKAEEQRWQTDIPRFPSEVVATAHELLAQNSGNRHVRRNIASVLSNFNLYEDMDEICMHLKFTPVEKHYGDGIHIFNYPNVRRGSLEHVLGISGQNIHDDKPSEHQVAQAVAVAHVVVAATVRDNDGSPTMAAFNTEKDYYPELVTLALRHPERGEELAAFILERGTDASLARFFLENGTRLDDGIL
jgi:hypothetical protein